METNTTNALQLVDERVLAQLGAMSPVIVVEQVKLVQAVMAGVMRKDEHYGMIPGTKKNCLYKSGAEKLCMTFQLKAEFDVDERQLDNGHREYVVTCHLSNRNGDRVATGVGSCSTLESKYRYRGNELVATGEAVPKTYWDLRKSNPKKAQELIGEGRTTKKDEAGNWMIFERGEKQENPDIADVWNTVLKMAKKRAHVDATITATAASDIFTQDVEDLPQYAADYSDVPGYVPQVQQDAPPARTPVAKPTSAPAAHAAPAPQSAPIEGQYTMVSPDAPTRLDGYAEQDGDIPDSAFQAPETFEPPTDEPSMKRLFAGWKLKVHQIDPQEAKNWAADMNGAPNAAARRSILVKMHADLTARGII